MSVKSSGRGIINTNSWENYEVIFREEEARDGVGFVTVGR